MVVDLVHAHAKEVHKHQLHNRAHARGGRAGGSADKGGLGDRCVHDALGAELVEQTAGGTKDAAVAADVFAHHKYRAVAGHFLGNSLGDGLGHGDYAWCVHTNSLVSA